MEKRANGKTVIDKIIWEININKYVYRVSPIWILSVSDKIPLLSKSPNITGKLVSFEVTYDNKNIDDKTKAESIEILCKLVLLFFIRINPVNKRIAVDPFKIAWKKGRELKSILSDSMWKTLGNNISKATTIGTTIDKVIIKGIKKESCFFIFFYWIKNLSNI